MTDTKHTGEAGKVALTEEQRGLLELLTLRPRAAVIRGIGPKLTLMEMIPSGFVSDVYQLSSGAFTAKITEAGRTALKAGGQP